MSSLEAKIKALLEGTTENTISESEIEELEEKETIKTKAGTTITDDDGEETDSHDEPDGDEDGEDTDNDGDGDSDEDTDFSKDKPDTKKDGAKVVEEETTGLKQNADNVSGAADTAKIKSGTSKKDEVKTGKVSADFSTGKLSSHEVKMLGKESDGAADTAKIKAGTSKKDEVKTGKIAGEHSVSEPNAKNQGNVKIAVSEHMDAIFNGEELSEEFKLKTQTIFEAAVEASAQARFESLKEEYEAELNEQAEQMASQINEAVEEVKSELVENIDDFLNVVVEEWVSDNQVALQSGVKVDLVDSFIDGMKNLFKEHYIEVPDEKVDVIQTQDDTITGLSEQVQSLEEQNAKLHDAFIAVKAENVFNKVSAGMTAVQLSKFRDLAETVEFTDEDDYVNKLATIKESYFAQKTIKSDELSETTIDQKQTDSMSMYAAAITKNIKFI